LNARLAKIALVASVGLFALLVGLDNIFDYDTNFDAVRHVLSMDTLPEGVAFGWRAVTLAALQNTAYWAIIVTELASGAFLIAGAGRMARAARYNAFIFNESKRLAIAGLVALFLLYFVGFLVVGGEWFEMWRSNGWNFQEAAFRFAAVIGVILIFVAQQDA
jgi:predicted small integral membrane protein